MLLSILFHIGCSDYEIISKDVGDVFYQLEAGEVDVLLVVDNSCSMAPYQEKLASNFESFLTYFDEGGIDYRIGVTTTTITDLPEPPYLAVRSCEEADDDQPCAEEEIICTQADVNKVPEPGYLVQNVILDRSVNDADAIFQNIVKVGVCGSGNEMGMESALRVLENPNNGFIREDAYLSVIYVSDEEDTSPLGVNTYINEMRALKDPLQRDIFNASSLVISDLAQCDITDRNFQGTIGTRYVDFADQTNGLIENICADDFSTIANELSLRSSRLNDIFFMSREPDPSSIILGVFDGDEDEEENNEDVEGIPCDGTGTYKWKYDLLGEGENAQPIIQFDRTTLPPPNSRITVQFNVGSGDPCGFCDGMYAAEGECNATDTAEETP